MDVREGISMEKTPRAEYCGQNKNPVENQHGPLEGPQGYGGRDKCSKKKQENSPEVRGMYNGI